MLGFESRVPEETARAVVPECERVRMALHELLPSYPRADDDSSLSTVVVPAFVSLLIRLSRSPGTL